MTKYKNLIKFISFLATFIISACGTGIPNVPSGYGWCYQFDFININYAGVSFTAGTTGSFGLTSITGQLEATYTHGTIIEPDYMVAEIYVSVPSGTRNVTAAFNAFGITENINTTIANGLDSAYIESEATGSEIFTNSITMDASTDSDVVIAVRSLRVYGDGTNPFGSDNCVDPVPIEWCYEWNYSNLFDGWTLPDMDGTGTLAGALDNSIYAGIITTGGPQRTLWTHTTSIGSGYSNRLFLTRNLSNIAGITDVTVNMVYTGIQSETSVFNRFTARDYSDVGRDNLDSTLLDVTQVGNTSTIIEDQNVIDLRNVDIEILALQAVTGTSVSGDPWETVTFDDGGFDAWIRYIQIRGVGNNNPFGSDNCVSGLPVSPTPSPTLSPTPLPTNEPLQTFTPVPTGTPEATLTAFPTVTPIPTNTPAPTVTPPPIQTPDPADDENTFTPDGTCENYAGGEPASETGGTWFEWLWGGTRNLVECTLLPPLNGIWSSIQTVSSDVVNGVNSAVQGAVNAINGAMQATANTLRNAVQRTENAIITGWNRGISVIQDFAAGVQGAFNATLDAVNGFFGWFGDIMRWLGGWFANVWNMMIHFLSQLTGAVWNIIVGLVTVVRDGIEAAVRFAKNILAFIGSGFGFAGNFYSLYNDTPPEPIPGLPDCVNSPLESNLCAVWYILEYTMFAGLVGAFIIPALVVYINLLIVMFFLETVVERMQKIWEVLRD